MMPICGRGRVSGRRDIIYLAACSARTYVSEGMVFPCYRVELMIYRGIPDLLILLVHVIDPREGVCRSLNFVEANFVTR